MCEFLKYYLTVTFIISFSIQKINAQNNFGNIIEAYKCPDSQLEIGKKIEVASYPFHTTVKLNLNDGFTGCAPGIQLEEASYYFLNNSEPFEIPGLNPENISKLEDEVFINPSGFLSVIHHFYPPIEYCIKTYRPKEWNEQGEIVPTLTFGYCPVNCTAEASKGQTGRPCIKKCCALGKSFDLSDFTCQPTKNKSWKGFFYDENSLERVYEKDLDLQPHYYKHVIDTTDCVSEIWFNQNLQDGHKQTTKLTKEGKILFVHPSRYWKVLEEEKICIDGILNSDEAQDTTDLTYSGKEEDQLVYFCALNITSINPRKSDSTIYMYFLFASSVFLLATAIIHVLLWDKQNTYGWTVFSLCVAQFFMRIFIGNAHRLGLQQDHENRSAWWCQANGILAHFFMLSSFTWLVAINFNIWQTFRVLTPRYGKTINLSDFFYYSAFAWGIPLIIVIVGVTLEYKYPDIESLVVIPMYGEECFVVRWAQGPYLYYIIAVLLTISFTLGVMTFIKIYGFKRQTSSARASNNVKKGDKKMFVYISIL